MRGPDFSHLSFLVVDDLPFVRQLVQGMLERMHAGRIAHAADGATALAQLRGGAEVVDCVISDWRMAPLGGLDLLQAIRTGAAAPTPRATAFIMLSGHGDEAAVRAARALDVSGYLIKPVSFDRLGQAVAQAVTLPVLPKPAAAYRDEMERQGIAVRRVIAGARGPAGQRPAQATKAPSGEAQSGEAPSGEAPSRDAPSGGAPSEEAAGPPPGLEVRLEDLAQIGPGTMLAQDVHSADGMLLLARGQTLDAGIVALLQRIALAEGNGDIKLRVTLAGH